MAAAPPTISAAIAGLVRDRDLEVALLVRVGSHAFGLERDGSDDDFQGVFIARLREILSIDGLASDTYAGSDPDYQLHEIGKLCRLALKGNPAILEMLWCPDVVAATPWGERLRALRARCLHRGTLSVYAAYAGAQLRKLKKGKGLHTKGGTYNGKFGAHLIRLLHAGIHLGRTGEVMVRVPESLLAALRRIRRDEVSAHEVEAMAASLVAELRAVEASTVLPAEPDRGAFEELAVAARLSRP
jgi:hypothetical protein